MKSEEAKAFCKGLAVDKLAGIMGETGEAPADLAAWEHMGVEVAAYIVSMATRLKQADTLVARLAQTIMMIILDVPAAAKVVPLAVVMSIAKVAKGRENADAEEHDCSTCDAADGCPIKDEKLRVSPLTH